MQMELDGWMPAHVKMQMLSTSVTDKSFPRPVVTPESQVVLKNEEAALHCQFTAEPAPTLEWYHENELLANKTRYVEG